MTAPIVQAALAAAAGTALALRLAPQASVAVGALIVAAAGCALLLRQRTGASLLFVFGALGCALGTTAALRAGADCRVRLRDGAAIVATGRFTTLPDSGARALLHANELRAGRVSCGDVELRVDLDESLRGTDSRVRVEGTWLRWPAAGFVRPERAGMLRVARVATLDAPAGLGLRERLQLDAQRRTRRLYGNNAPLVEALLLARTETLPRAVRARFADSGLVHLLAISGTHVVLILGVLLVLAQAARLSGRSARACALAGVVAYVLFLGAPPPAARAALQLGLLSIGRALQRPSDALSALAVSALLLIVIEPTVVLDAGAQLSFAGVGGIIAFAPALERLMQRLPRPVVRPLAAGLAASATTLPIAGLHFGTLAPIGIIAGLPGIPITAVAVPAAALPIVLSFVSHGAAAFLVPAAALSLRALDRVAALAAAIPGGHGYASPGDVHALLLAGAAAIVALRATAGHLDAPGGAPPRQSVSSALLPGLAAAAGLAFVLGLRPALAKAIGGSVMELHVLDVGQGDALAI
ncbi:MAG: ComEC/Rec2 family competence protein, partial [Longimicrobiales bacterium]